MAAVDTTASVINLSKNTWTKNEKIKTCKCDGCGNRVTDFSYQCSECLRHICSVCLDPGSKQSLRTKAFAQWHLTKHCFCKFRSHMDPKFEQSYPREAPPHRTEEEMQARISRNLAASSRKPKQSKATAAKNIALREATLDSDDEDTFDVKDDVPESPQRTIAATKPKREGLKRKQYVNENQDEDENLDEDEALKSKLKKQKSSGHISRRGMLAGNVSDRAVSKLADLDGETTVVVGSGVVGLFIAHEIALEAHRAGIEHHVVVIELRQTCCELASGHCAGLLSTKGVPEDWSPLAEVAEECWFDTIASSDARSSLNFSGNTKSQVVEAEAGETGAAPRWLQGDISWALVEDECALGRIDPNGLAAWLYKQCVMLGVKFHFEHLVTSIEVSTNNNVSGLQMCDINDEESTTDVSCSNLVLAAGAFTSGIFNRHFTTAPLNLENTMQSAHWFRAKATPDFADQNIAYRFPRAASSVDRLEDEVCIVAEDSTILVSNIATSMVNKHLNTSLVREPSHGKISELMDVAARCLDTKMVDLTKKDNITDRGRSELSVANNMCPIIDTVTKSGLGLVGTSDVEGQQSCGVWLCYGFGKHGTTLAPGAARMLVSKMFGNAVDTTGEIDAFQLPALLQPQAESESKGKDKGKGKMKA